MDKIFGDIKPLERAAEQQYQLTEDIMIENAAAALERTVRTAFKDRTGTTGSASVLIVCGCGNNGADGYALARRITGSVPVGVYPAVDAESESCRKQQAMAVAAGMQTVNGASFLEKLPSCTVLVDCLYGTGFHGSFDGTAAELIRKVNSAHCFRIACDIPSGIDSLGSAASGEDGGPLAFNADVTVTMGSLKLSLFSDAAKDFCGMITTADIGVSRPVFENSRPDAYLLSVHDMQLPVRDKKSVHKGNYGHAAVIAGEKSGAAVIAGTAAFNFGAGLVTLVDACSERKFPLEVPPELMSGKELPANTTAVLLGSGLGRTDYQITALVSSWLAVHKTAGLVLDADVFYYPGIAELLRLFMEKCPDARIVCTPHPKEFQSLLQLCSMGNYTVPQVVCRRFELVKLFTSRFPDIVLVLKGANTFISCSDGVYVSTEGCPCLAKAGSGDVLAGLICALLAQGYTAESAAVTGVLAQGAASRYEGSSYSMTPLKLIKNVTLLQNL
jgi:ADP-dependent NAD(P)H-hydrate dehydratase / NAD(P)H-hydrate epimerase